MNIFLGYPPANVEKWIKDHYSPKIINPLCFTAEDAGATIAFNKVGSPDEASIVYATKKSGQRATLDWQPYEFNKVVTLENEGDKVYFAAATENDISFYKDDENYYRFATTEGKPIAASGNIQTLMKADGSRLDISGKNNCYTQMFYECTSLTTAPELPATTLAEYCYQQMFSDCSSLTTAPSLPATILANYCYDNMFHGCTSLTPAPTIKTYTSGLYAFNSMLDVVDNNSGSWGSLYSCHWLDLTLAEAESMVLTELIFGYGDSNIHASISITCKDGSATVYYDSEKSSWVFER